VLISPYALTGVNRVEQTIAVNLTKDKIKNSPSPDTDKPISRQFENYYYGYYAYGRAIGEDRTVGAAYPYMSRMTATIRATGCKTVRNSITTCAAPAW
jgi:hypothetical protein